MAKYIKKPVIVEAEQFLLEEQHPVWGSSKVINVPEGVMKHQGCGYRMCDVCGGANSNETIYYLPVSGESRYLSNRDWVLTFPNGEKDICKADFFDKNYEKIK